MCRYSEVFGAHLSVDAGFLNLFLLTFQTVISWKGPFLQESDEPGPTWLKHQHLCEVIQSVVNVCLLAYEKQTYPLIVPGAAVFSLLWHLCALTPLFRRSLENQMLAFLQQHTVVFTRVFTLYQRYSTKTAGAPVIQHLPQSRPRLVAVKPFSWLNKTDFYQNTFVSSSLWGGGLFSSETYIFSKSPGPNKVLAHLCQNAHVVFV